MITEKTLNWAKSHDWGQFAYLEDGVLKGLEDVQVHRDGRVTVDIVEFADRSELRAWAGY